MMTPEELKREDLKKWAKKNQKFISLDDGESITFRLVDFRTTTKDIFGEEKDVVKYTCELPDGSQKVFENGSPAIANRMSDFLGKVVTLTRRGLASKTKYLVEEFQGEPPF